MNHVMHFEIFATISHKMHHPYYLFHPSNNVMTGWMDNLGECIKIKTVSARITNNSYYSVPYNISYVKEFEQMLIFLNKTFPTVFNNDFVQVLVLVYLHDLTSPLFRFTQLTSTVCWCGWRAARPPATPTCSPPTWTWLQ